MSSLARNLMLLLCGIVGLLGIPAGVVCLFISHYQASGGKMFATVFGRMNTWDYAGVACILVGVICLNIVLRARKDRP